jgi:arachidonate 15-lipoxygenase
MLDGALLGTFGPTPEQQKYLYPAIALFAVPDQSHEDRYLLPIAIQCGQDPKVHPIMTPSSGDYAWLAAKSAIQVADSTIHEAISHLACTHLLVDPFVVATHRQLPESHPVYRLLLPHFEGTILINFGAWKLLTAKGQAVNSLLPPVIAQSRTVAVQGLRQLGFNDQMLPKRLEARGVMDQEALPLYPYRDDGLAIWEALHNWVNAYIRLQYDSDSAVLADNALQNWAQELVALDGGRIEEFGNDGDGVIKTVDYLVEALTMIIFTGSAQHAAVNFPQKFIMSFTPAMPMSGYIPGEEIPTIQSEEDWCNMLPPEDQAKQQLQILQILGGVNYTNLGQYRDDQKKRLGADAAEALTQFQNRLAEIELTITKRNDEIPGKFKYEFLKPSNIPQSINI